MILKKEQSECFGPPLVPLRRPFLHHDQADTHTTLRGSPGKFQHRGGTTDELEPAGSWTPFPKEAVISV